MHDESQPHADLDDFRLLEPQLPGFPEDPADAEDVSAPGA